MHSHEQPVAEPPITELTRRIMSRVSSRDTTPELVVRRALHRAGLRFRLHDRRLPGTPDIVLSRWRTVVFVHGCFWHRHPGCRKATMPKTRTEFWQSKFDRNVERDGQALISLRALNWRAEVVWECETKNVASLDRRLRAIFDLDL